MVCIRLFWGVTVYQIIIITLFYLVYIALGYRSYNIGYNGKNRGNYNHALDSKRDTTSKWMKLEKNANRLFFPRAVKMKYRRD